MMMHSTILVVDDDSTIRMIAKYALENFGFRVLTACNGFDGVNALANNRDEIDAVVLDIEMPIMDGREAYQEMRKIREDIPVIVSSGCQDEQLRSPQNFVGRTRFLDKPYGLPALIEKLREVLGERVAA